MQGKSALESKLREKEQLIGVLTQRLEQAAEHLDRIQRSGGDRGVRIPGIPPEVVERHQALVEDLQKAVQQWEESQPTEILSRIERQVAEIREIVAGSSFRPPAPEPVQPDSISEFMTRMKSGGAQEPAPRAGSYEHLKASLLQDDAGEEITPPTGQDAHDESAEVEAVEPPTPVDFDTADLDQLKQAVERRDAYIAFLSRRLRLAEADRGPKGDWKSLENVPDELRTQLEQYERRLEEALRHAEVELSMERARLAREASRLRMMEQQVAATQKRLELIAEEKLPATRSTPRTESDEDGKSSRWLRMLGIGRDENED